MRNYSCISRIYVTIGLIVLCCIFSILLTNLAFDSQEQNRQSNVLLQVGVLIGTLLLLTPFITALIRSITRPLYAIMRDVKNFESGDFSPLKVDFKPQGSDELAQLSQVLFDAGKDLLKQRKQITTQNRLLAKKNKELEVQLQRETQARQEVDHLKTEKLGDLVNLHHELRTPLAGIVASVEM